MISRLFARSRDRSEDGQVLVIVGVGLIGFIAMVGLVIDGGNAWGQQRRTQNGTDAVAMAGTVVVQHHLARIGSPPPSGGDVGCAVAAAATANNVTLETAEYTNYQGQPLGSSVAACGSGAAIPSGAQGVKAVTTREIDAYLMGIVGFSTLTVRADATAIVGSPSGVCPATLGCGTLPVTFPRTVDTCDGSNKREIGEGPWEILNPDAGDVLDANTLATVPLCQKAPGSVGWLDHSSRPDSQSCGNLNQQIANPCHGEIPIPAWLKTQPGNPNVDQDALNDKYAGDQIGVAEPEDQVLYIPIHDFTCDQEAAGFADDEPVESCSSHPDWSGQGDNLYYHVPYWVGFKLDQAYTRGNDPECNQSPGNPPAAGNGATGCLEGWFIGRLDAPGTVTATPINPGDPVPMGIALVN